MFSPFFKPTASSNSNVSEQNFQGVNLKVYPMLGNLQPETFKYKRLMRSDQFSPYSILTYSNLDTNDINDPAIGDAKVHNSLGGWFLFVIRVKMPHAIFVRRDPNDAVKPWKQSKGALSDRGHSSVAASGEAVLWGGCLFLEEGRVIKWDNDSGHYKCGKNLGFAALKQLALNQTQFALASDGSRLLPEDSFHERPND